MLTSPAQIEQKPNSLAVVTFANTTLTGLDMQEVVNDLTQQMRHNNTRFFVFDMAAVEFLASDCLGSMVIFLRDLEHIRGRLALASCQPNVKFLFKVTRLDEVFPNFDDVAEAIEELTT